MTRLLEEIKQYQSKFLQKAPVEKQRLMAEATAELAASGVAKGLGVGDTIPNFTLPDVSGELVAIETLLEQGPVILTFYRGGWCPYCNIELRAYEREIDRIRAQRATVVAISPETADFTEQTASKNALSFPVLSDVDLLVSRQFDLVFDFPDYLIEIYKASGLDVAKHNGNEDWQLPKPATFIIDVDGMIRFAEVSSDYTKRVDPEHILQNLE